MTSSGTQAICDTSPLPLMPRGSRVRSVDVRGPAGRLEALLNEGSPDAPFAALVCHPHPLGGGTMHNKVVYHAAKAFSSFGLPVLRFNFRGTGLSEGVHDEGRGDRTVKALTWRIALSLTLFILLMLGFEFGIITPHTIM